MRDSYDFKVYREIKQKIRNISKRLKILEKEQDKLKLK